MRAFQVPVAGTILVIALIAIDFAVVKALRPVPTLGVRVAFLGALPMASLAAACAVFAAAGLARRGEVALSLVTFVVVGGASVLALIATAILAQALFFECLDLTVGFYRGPRKHGIELRLFGIVGTGRPAVLCVYAAMSLPLFVPALLGGWMTRGQRLRLVSRPGADAPAAYGPNQGG